MSLDALICEAGKLNREEQGELLDALLEIVHSQSPPLTPAQEADLMKRVAEADANPGDSRPWSEVQARLWSKYLHVPADTNVTSGK